MALILAIEPDRRQAGQLTAMVKGRLHAEFVIGDSAESALAALGSRVPDLVLTTALLSPKDETALSERLRALDGAAAHVQTLTIPMLATSRRRNEGGKGGGVLSALLGDKSKSDSFGAEGCDPAMFAEQCKEYLERAAAERSASIEEIGLPAELPDLSSDCAPQSESVTTVEFTSPPESTAPVDFTEFTAAPALTSSPELTASEELPACEEVPAFEDVPASPELTVSSEFTAPPTAERRVFIPHVIDDEPPAALIAAVAALADEDDQPIDAAPAPVAFSALQDEDGAQPAGRRDVVDFDLSSILNDRPDRAVATADDEESPAPVYEVDTSSFDLQDAHETHALTAEIESNDADRAVNEGALYTPLAKPEVRTWPILEGIATGTGTIEDSLVSETPLPAAVERADTDDLREWSDIIEALRRDAQPVALRQEPEPIPTVQPPAVVETVELAPELFAPDLADPEPFAPQPSAPEPVSADPAPAELPAVRRKLRRKSSVEDEWGFFDPDRAGFAALLAKLEEITEDDPRKPQRT